MRDQADVGRRMAQRDERYGSHRCDRPFAPVGHSRPIPFCGQDISWRGRHGHSVACVRKAAIGLPRMVGSIGQAASLRSPCRTRSRPAAFASNSARSALRYIVFQSISRWSGPTQVPMLAVTPRSNGMRWPRSPSSTSRASSGAAAGVRIANSSPPMRAISDSGAATDRSARAKTRNTSSPPSWPMVSLTALK
ncbi:hypothetical protein WR25_04742 [Diploscapter pachys]|uniref:Uncharacterized protein n=1 Tax=Diploscapter pachys TaxID=2018661 RepID=A0A2A2KI44_9BILA|nr:hypothetical protein WR25_04742 [Diploscapter pachys]